MSSGRSFLLLLFTVVTFLLFAEGFRFSVIPSASSIVRKSLRSVDHPKIPSISCNQFLIQEKQSTGQYPEFITCLRASKDMPNQARDFVGKFSSSRFTKLGHHHVRQLPIRETKVAAKLSHLSYLEEFGDDENNHEGQLPMVLESDPVAQTRAHVWIDKESKTAFVSFRGTSSWVDVLHDLDTRPVPADPSRRPEDITVHAGFRLKFFAIKEALEDLLVSNQHEFETVIVTGHSLGGALATIAAPFLADYFPTKIVKCISFGSPRVGNENFVKWFNSAVDTNVRVINEHDPVPHLPLGPAYHHVSDGVCIVPDSAAIYSFAEIPVGERLLWAMENLDLSQLTTAHDLKTYINRVNMYN